MNTLYRIPAKHNPAETTGVLFSCGCGSQYQLLTLEALCAEHVCRCGICFSVVDDLGVKKVHDLLDVLHKLPIHERGQRSGARFADTWDAAGDCGVAYELSDPFHGF